MTIDQYQYPTLKTIDRYKFRRNKQPEEFKGATIVCHLDQTGPNSSMFSSLLQVYRELIGVPYADKLSLLPPSSYHMTIVSCSNRFLIPATLDSSAGGDHDSTFLLVEQKLKEEFIGYKDMDSFPIIVKAKEFLIKPTSVSLIVESFNQEEEIKLRKLRKEVTDILGIDPELDFKFHITIGYFVDTVDPIDVDILNERMTLLFDELIKGQTVEFSQMEFCFFKDMFEFNVHDILK